MQKAAHLFNLKETFSLNLYLRSAAPIMLATNVDTAAAYNPINRIKVIFTAKLITAPITVVIPFSDGLLKAICIPPKNCIIEEKIIAVSKIGT